MHLQPMEGELTTVEEVTDSKKGQEGHEVEESTVRETPIIDNDQEECSADS